MRLPRFDHHEISQTAAWILASFASTVFVRFTGSLGSKSIVLYCCVQLHDSTLLTSFPLDAGWQTLAHDMGSCVGLPRWERYTSEGVASYSETVWTLRSLRMCVSLDLLQLLSPRTIRAFDFTGSMAKFSFLEWPTLSCSRTTLWVVSQALCSLKEIRSQVWEDGPVGKALVVQARSPQSGSPVNARELGAVELWSLLTSQCRQ